MDLKDIKSDKKKGTEEDINIAYDIDSIRQIEKMRQAEQVEYENVEGYGRMLQFIKMNNRIEIVKLNIYEQKKSNFVKTISIKSKM